MLASVVFGYFQSLQEVWSFRVHFGSQVVLPAARQVGFVSAATSPISEEASP